MSFGGDWSSWITGILMALTVTVGLLGIFQDRHRKDGKLTRVGWGLVGAIVLLGVATFLSSLRDQRLAEEKEQADSAERGRQFQSQMSALREVTGSLSQVRTDMRDSLRSQRELSGVADENLRMSAALQAQAQANTLTVLRRVFEEGNRLSAERVALAVTYCPRIDRYTDRFELNAAVVWARASSGLQIALRTEQKVEVQGQIIFHGFVGELGPFERFDTWRAAQVDIGLGASPPASRAFSVDDLAQMTDEESARGGRIPPGYECPVTVTLILNGREVLRADGQIVAWQGAIHYANFGNLRVDPRALPRF